MRDASHILEKSTVEGECRNQVVSSKNDDIIESKMGHIFNQKKCFNQIETKL